MNQYDEVQVSVWLKDGIAAAKAGRREEARELLMNVVEVNDRSEQAWLWLSGVVDDKEDQVVCLENVLALNPDNVQARTGVKFLREQGVGVDSPVEELETEALDGLTVFPTEPEWQLRIAEEGRQKEKEPENESVGVMAQPAERAPGNVTQTGKESDLVLTPEGCVYCGLVVGENDARCRHCGGKLTAKRFKNEERSFLGNALHAFWILLVGINLIDFFLISFVWNNVDGVAAFFEKAFPFYVGPVVSGESAARSFLPYVVGPVVTGDSVVEMFVGPDVLMLIVRFTLLGLAVLGGLDAVALFLRRPLAHTYGLILIAAHLIIGLVLFALGFLGFLLAVFRALMTLLLTVFMFNTVDDFSKEERREQLRPDRHLLNDADFFARGRIYEKQGMWAKALLHWRRAAGLNPTRDTYQAAMARACTHLGRHEQALAHIDEALRISRRPEEWQALREIIVEAQQRVIGRS